MRLLVIGASAGPVCGVRDCARTLDAALRELGAETEKAWWDRHAEPGPEPWLERIRATRPDVVLWHYSPTVYGPRGVPTLVPRVLAAARATGAPLVPFLHELAHGLRSRGWRGLVQGATQRAALARVVAGAAGTIVTTEERERWLRTRRWLPSRPVTFVPVPSNVPVAAEGGHAPNGTLRIGVFGFRAGGGLSIGVVTAAVGALGRDAKLVLVGAPGPDDPEASRWRTAAAADGCALEFTGILEPDALSRALSALDLMVLPDATGPSARKGTLAAALAHGRPVVGLAGPSAWDALCAARAVELAQPDPGSVGSALRRLAASPDLRRGQGERGRAFYERTMSAEVVAGQVLAFVAAPGAPS